MSPKSNTEITKTATPLREIHGNYNCYTAGCRCAECLTGWKEYRLTFVGTDCFKCGVPRNVRGNCTPCSAASARLYRAKNPERHKNRRRLWNYGISNDTYDRMLEEQNGVCRICSEVNANGVPLGIDHNHTTGMVRGLLCAKCNFGIGHFNEDVELMAEAIQYLKEHNQNG